MSNAPTIDDMVRSLVGFITLPETRLRGLDTVHVLVQLAQKPDWLEDDEAAVDFLSRKLDVTGKLYAGYDPEGRVTDNNLISDPDIWALAFLVFHRAFTREVSDGSSRGVGLKRFNTLLKCADRLESPSSAIQSLVDDLPELVSDAMPQTGMYGAPPLDPATVLPPDHPGGVLPLTVLFHESPIARAYLETIRSLGCQPERIINLVPDRDLASGKPIGRWIPGILRNNYTASVQQSRIHYWPQRLRKQNPDLVNAFEHSVEAHLRFSATVLSEAHALRELPHYCDIVETLVIENFDDEALLHHLNGLPASVFLFTGGGIVPRRLLSMPSHRFVHIHPGYLPDIRGADCVLWSSLLANRLSASCFYLALGIDTGDVIFRTWIPELRINEGSENLKIKDLYRTVYSYLDPWVRAYVLRQVICQNMNFDDINAVPQDESDGVTFHFMHPKLQHAAIKSIMN